MNAEVIIVGAGPAGATAAAALARNGRRVLLLEAGRFPRDKVCGDVLLPEVDVWLRAIGSSRRQLVPEAREVEGCRYHTPAGRVVEGRFRDLDAHPRSWLVIPRRVFDSRLAAWACRQGAELHDSHRVQAVAWDPRRRMHRVEASAGGGRRVFEAPIVIAADGAAGATAAARGLSQRRPGGFAQRALALRGYLDWSDPESCFRVYTSRRLLPGCAWIVPGPDGRANVGVGLVASDGRGADMRRLLEELVLAPLGHPQVSGLRGWSLPAHYPGGPLVADGFLCVGDAAGLVDPFTGHGIHLAMASALAAAEAADRALASQALGVDDPPLRDYRRVLRDGPGAELALGWKLQRLHRRPAAVEAMAALAAADAGLADLLMGLVGHAWSRGDANASGMLRWLGARAWGRSRFAQGAA